MELKPTDDRVTMTSPFNRDVYTVCGCDFSYGDELVIEGTRDGKPRIVSFVTGHQRAAVAVGRWLSPR